MSKKIKKYEDLGAEYFCEQCGHVCDKKTIRDEVVEYDPSRFDCVGFHEFDCEVSDCCEDEVVRAKCGELNNELIRLNDDCTSFYDEHIIYEDKSSEFPQRQEKSEYQELMTNLMQAQKESFLCLK